MLSQFTLCIFVAIYLLRMEKLIHQGRNIKRFREMLGIKQEAMALALGEDWNQRKISLLEQKPTIEPRLLQQIAGFLEIPPASILHFDEETALQLITELGSTTLTREEKANTLFSSNSAYNKIIELYDALLQAEREKSVWIQKLLDYHIQQEKQVPTVYYTRENVLYQVEEDAVPYYLWQKETAGSGQKIHN